MRALKATGTKAFWKMFLLMAALAASMPALAQSQWALGCNQNTFPNTMSVNNPVAMICVANGGTAPYMYAVSAGSLPTGIGFIQAGQQFLIQGTPTVTGVYMFTVTATDNASATSSLNFTITVVASLSSVTPTTLAAGTAATLTLNGAGFSANSIVFFNGNPVSTTLQDSSTLMASVPANLVVAGSLPVYVRDTSTGAN